MRASMRSAHRTVLVSAPDAEGGTELMRPDELCRPARRLTAFRFAIARTVGDAAPHGSAEMRTAADRGSGTRVATQSPAAGQSADDRRLGDTIPKKARRARPVIAKSHFFSASLSHLVFERVRPPEKVEEGACVKPKSNQRTRPPNPLHRPESCENAAPIIAPAGIHAQPAPLLRLPAQGDAGDRRRETKRARRRLGWMGPIRFDSITGGQRCRKDA